MATARGPIMPRSEIKPVQLGSSIKENCIYGVSIKCWLKGQFYKLPRIYESSVRGKPKYILMNAASGPLRAFQAQIMRRTEA